MFPVPRFFMPRAGLLWLLLLHPLAATAQGDASAAAVGVNAKAPPLGMAAARGDGRADDTAALQAQVRYCQDHNVPLLLPSGVYKITSPLHVSVPPDDQTATYIPILSGIVIRGLTNAAVDADARAGYGTGGVTIQMAGRGQDAVIEVDGAASIDMRIADITLDGGAAALATKYALHAGYTHWSGLRLDNVQTKNTDTAIAVTGTTRPEVYGSRGGNGEALDCYSCRFVPRHTAYLNTSDSGQAYLHRFFACSIWIRQPGGVAFEIGNGNLGCQCDFYGTSMTMTPGGPTPNVFFQDDGTSDPINWWGGRAEQVDTLIKWTGGSGNESAHVNIQGMAFPVSQGRGPLFSGGGTNCNYFFTVRSCYFQSGGTPAPLGFLYGGGGFEHIKLDECDFVGWSDLTALVNSPHVFLSDCRYVGPDGVAHDLSHREAPAKKAPAGGRHPRSASRS